MNQERVSLSSGVANENFQGLCNLVVICSVIVKPKTRPPDVMKVPAAIDSTSCNKLTNFSGLYDSWKFKELLNSLPMTSFH